MTFLVPHANQSGTELHEAKRTKVPVRAASTANVTLATPGSTLDTVTLVNGDRILLWLQTAQAENGIYVWSSAITALTRATDAATAADFVFGFKVYVREGLTNGASTWTYTQSAAVTLGTTALQFAKDGALPSQITITGEMDASSFRATGLTGATATSLYGGATVSGAPTTGAWVVGAWVVDQTGSIWVCTVAGGPGTWVQVGTAVVSYSPSGLTGSTAASRYVGATASGAPVSGLHATGDFVIDQTGKIWICTAGGTPGTWAQVSGTGGGGATVGGSSGGGALQPIAVIGPIGSAQASASFASIPAGFRNLRIKWQARGDTAATSTSLQLQFNGDTTAKYDRQLAFGQGSSAGAVESLTQTSMSVGEITASTSTAGSAASGEIDIVNYVGTTLRKQVTAHNALKRGTDGTTSTFLNESWSGEWRSTAAITSILLFPLAGNFDIGSYFVLYGELDTAAQSATAPAITTGGTITTSGVAEARVAPAGAVTGNILQAGTYGAQEITVTNESAAANTITFAASGTSNVADGTNVSVAGLRARKFVWNSATSLWYLNG